MQHSELCMLPSMDSSKETTLILGLGNILLTDEAVGVRVIEALREHQDRIGLDLKLIDGGTIGMMLLVDMEDADALIVIDAAHLNKQAGEIQVFEGEAMDTFLRNRGRSPHDIGLDDLMDGLRLREALPLRRALIGIEPKTLTIGDSLTQEVAAAVPRAAATAIGLLKHWGSPKSGTHGYGSAGIYQR